MTQDFGEDSEAQPPAASGPPIGLWAPVALALIAGYVDAIAFVHLFEVFPANQSGNAILVGIAIGEADTSKILPPITSLVGFFAGVFISVLLAYRIPTRWQIEILLSLQLVLLLITAIRLQFIPSSDLPLSGTEGTFALLAVSGAMGVQTYAVRVTSGIPVATTYQSGALDQIARRAAVLTADHKQVKHPFRLEVLAVILLAYIVGAALGAALSESGPRLLWIACVGTLLVLAVRMLRTRNESVR